MESTPVGSLSDLAIGGHNKVKRRLVYLIKISLILNLILSLIFIVVIFLFTCNKVHQKALKLKVIQRGANSTFLPFTRNKISGEQQQQHRLTHVVIPFHVKQLGKMIYFMEQWDLFPPCPDPEHLNSLLEGDNTITDSITNSIPFTTNNKKKEKEKEKEKKDDQDNLNDYRNKGSRAEHLSHAKSLGRNVTLIVFMNTKRDIEIETKISRTFHSLLDKTKSCFSGIRFRYANLVGERDSYLMGSRMMFELMLKGNAALDNADYVFYMEPDCLPIKPNWLSMIDSHTRWPNPPFWLKGSVFRGSMKVVSTTNIVNMFHINGNAIYNLRDTGLQRFYFRKVRKFVQNIVRKEGAYDTDMAMYLQDGHFLTEALSLAHKFQFSEFIQNLYHSNYSVSGLSRKNEITAIAHGGFPLT